MKAFKQFCGSIVICIDICIDQSAFMLLDFHAEAMHMGGWGRENPAAQLFAISVAGCREGPGRKTETVRVFATSQQAAETTRFAKRFARCFRVKES